MPEPVTNGDLTTMLMSLAFNSVRRRFRGWLAALYCKLQGPTDSSKPTVAPGAPKLAGSSTGNSGAPPLLGGAPTGQGGPAPNEPKRIRRAEGSRIQDWQGVHFFESVCAQRASHGNSSKNDQWRHILLKLAYQRSLLESLQQHQFPPSSHRDGSVQPSPICGGSLAMIAYGVGPGQTSAEHIPCRPTAPITISDEQLRLGTFNEIGEYVARATHLFKEHGWHRTCHLLRDCLDIHAGVKNLNHKAAPIMERLRRNGAPVILSSAPWSVKKSKRDSIADPTSQHSRLLIFWAPNSLIF
jgi:hypothetical protein